MDDIDEEEILYDFENYSAKIRLTHIKRPLGSERYDVRYAGPTSAFQEALSRLRTYKLNWRRLKLGAPPIWDAYYRWPDGARGAWHLTRETFLTLADLFSEDLTAAMARADVAYEKEYQAEKERRARYEEDMHSAWEQWQRETGDFARRAWEEAQREQREENARREREQFWRDFINDFVNDMNDGPYARGGTNADSGSSSSRSVPARVRDALKVLELPESASLDDVKKVYRQLARTHHPDLHMQDAESVRREHEAVLKRVNGAYAIVIEWLAPAKA